jgi:hypothetical protein
MGACLDSKAVLQSPSTERRILIGIAALALSSYLFSTSGMFDSAVGDVAVTTADSTIFAEFAALTAGISRLAGEALPSDIEGNAISESVVEGSSIARNAFLDHLLQFGEDLIEFFLRFV